MNIDSKLLSFRVMKILIHRKISDEANIFSYQYLTLNRFEQKQKLLLGIVTDPMLEIGFLGTCNQPKNGFKASWAKFFFIFCQIFVHIWWFFKISLSAQFTLKIFQICQKIWKKFLLNLPVTINQFLHGTPKTRNLGFEYPICH